MDNRQIVKSSVVPSQRINNEKHCVWILCSSNGDIITGYCSCTVGLCQCCNHVVAVLYKIEFANEKGLTDPTCTEQVCAWNCSSKEIGPIKIKDMNIREHNKNSSEPNYFINNLDKRNFDPRLEQCRDAKCKRVTFK